MKKLLFLTLLAFSFVYAQQLDQSIATITFLCKDRKAAYCPVHFLSQAFLGSHSGRIEFPHDSSLLLKALSFSDIAKNTSFSPIERLTQCEEVVRKQFPGIDSKFETHSSFIAALVFLKFPHDTIQIISLALAHHAKIPHPSAQRYFEELRTMSENKGDEAQDFTAPYLLLEDSSQELHPLETSTLSNPMRRTLQEVSSKKKMKVEGNPVIDLSSVELPTPALTFICRLIKELDLAQTLNFQVRERKELLKRLIELHGNVFTSLESANTLLRALFKLNFPPDSMREIGDLMADYMTRRDRYHPVSSTHQMYEALMQENMRSFREEQTKDRSLSALLSEKSAEVAQPKDRTKSSRAYGFLDQIATQDFLVAPVLDQKSWQDLELFCGPKNYPEIYYASLLKTCTQLGQAVLYQQIVLPTADISTLEKRQALTKALFDNKPLLDQLITLLKKLAQAENAVLAFWAPEDDLLQMQLAQKYYRFDATKINEWLNSNQIMLEIGNVPDEFNLLICTLVKGAKEKYRVVKRVALCQLLGAPTVSFGVNGVLSFLESTLSLVPNTVRFVQGVIDPSSLIGGRCSLSFNEGKPIVMPQFLSVLQYGDADELFSFISDQRSKLHARLLHLANYVRAVQEISGLKVPFKEYIFPHMDTFPKGSNPAAPQDKNLLQTSLVKWVHENILKDIYTHVNSFETLLKKLNTSTFEKENANAYWIFLGRLYAVSNLMSKHKNRLQGIMLEIAELDAHATAALLMHQCKTELDEYNNLPPEEKAHRAKPVSLCFPRYDTSDQPFVELKNFWNLSLKNQALNSHPSIVTNSLSIGGQGNPRLVIITGPNGGGKSTTLKSFISSVIMAQSLGIAPAESMTLTPFPYIKAYLNITDDIASGKSLFQAAAARSFELYSAAKLAGSPFSFLAFDEAFAGTDEMDAEAAAYALFHYIISRQNVLCVSTTHLKKVRDLAHNSPLCKMYKVTVDPQFKPDFKLTEGASDQNIALHVLGNAGFPEEFIKATEELREAFRINRTSS